MEETLVIIGSARKNGTTQHFVDVIFEKIPNKQCNLLDFNLAPYNYEAHYPETDGFDQLIDQILSHQTIVLATPVYWYAMSGIMKNLFDRLTDLVTIKKEIGRAFKNKKLLLLATGTDTELPIGFEIPFKLTADYLDMHYTKSIYLIEKEPIDSKSALVKLFIADLK